ncbi:cysteine hydrolase family protein [Salinispora arenicola]|uniref:cysteine hydrolase family protein n=1 Tax=Salinispora arenicola TaxID=168697 RepID=UPI00036650D0|nr:cysteine hydrolase family protein [Salinispora arenicola]
MPISSTALLVIDLQVGFLHATVPTYRADALLTTVKDLQDRAREQAAPVVFLQHDGAAGHPTQTGSPGWAIEPAVAPVPGDVVVRKRSCDCFHGSDLDGRLRQLGVTSLVVTGVMTELCVDTTCRRAITMGYDVTLVADGHSTVDYGPPELPAPEMRIRLTNHVLSRLINHDRRIVVRPAHEVAFVSRRRHAAEDA